MSFTDMTGRITRTTLRGSLLLLIAAVVSVGAFFATQGGLELFVAFLEDAGASLDSDGVESLTYGLALIAAALVAWLVVTRDP